MGVMNFLFGSEPRRQFALNGVRYVFANGDDGDRIKVDLMSLPAVASAVGTMAADVAVLPAQVFMRDGEDRQRLRNSLDACLNQQPNPNQNAYEFWRTVAMQATIGESFVLAQAGCLSILPYGRTWQYTTADGEIRVAVTMTPQEAKTAGKNPDVLNIAQDYPSASVLHLYDSVDEYGQPFPLRARFKAVFGLGSGMYDYTSRLYNRGGVLAGYLTNDNGLSVEQKTNAITSFKSLFKKSSVSDGTDIKLAALDNGWKYQKLDLSPQEMMLLEGKKDFISDVARIFRMPAWKLGLTEGYHYSTAEAAQRDYLQTCLNPLLVQLEREINNKLITPFERSAGVYVEINRDKIIQVDASTMATIDDLAIKNGGMSLNEWRARRNLPAVAGGDIRQIPVNVTSAAFVARAEVIKLEGLKLANDLKAAQIDQTKSSQQPAQTPPAASGTQVTENPTDPQNSQ